MQKYVLGQVLIEHNGYKERVTIIGKNATMINISFNGETTSYRLESDLLKNGHETVYDINKAYIIFDTLEYRLDLTSVIKQVILAVKAKQEK